MAWIMLAEAMHRKRMEDQKKQQEALNPPTQDFGAPEEPEKQREPFDPSPYWQPEAVPPPPVIQPTPTLQTAPQAQIVAPQPAPKVKPYKEEDDEDRPYSM